MPLSFSFLACDHDRKSISPDQKHHHGEKAAKEECVLTMLDMLPYLRVLPWVAVETAPATVWSMYQEKEGSVHPSGCFTVLHPAPLACQIGVVHDLSPALLLLACYAHM